MFSLCHKRRAYKKTRIRLTKDVTSLVKSVEVFVGAQPPVERWLVESVLIVPTFLKIFYAWLSSDLKKVYFFTLYYNFNAGNKFGVQWNIDE